MLCLTVKSFSSLVNVNSKLKIQTSSVFFSINIWINWIVHICCMLASNCLKILNSKLKTLTKVVLIFHERFVHICCMFIWSLWSKLYIIASSIHEHDISKCLIFSHYICKTQTIMSSKIELCFILRDYHSGVFLEMN